MTTLLVSGEPFDDDPWGLMLLELDEKSNVVSKERLWNQRVFGITYDPAWKSVFFITGSNFHKIGGVAIIPGESPRPVPIATPIPHLFGAHEIYFKNDDLWVVNTGWEEVKLLSANGLDPSGSHPLSLIRKQGQRVDIAGEVVGKNGDTGHFNSLLFGQTSFWALGQGWAHRRTFLKSLEQHPEWESFKDVWVDECDVGLGQSALYRYDYSGRYLGHIANLHSGEGAPGGIAAHDLAWADRGHLSSVLYNASYAATLMELCLHTWNITPIFDISKHVPKMFARGLCLENWHLPSRVFVGLSNYRDTDDLKPSKIAVIDNAAIPSRYGTRPTPVPELSAVIDLPELREINCVKQVGDEDG